MLTKRSRTGSHSKTDERSCKRPAADYLRSLEALFLRLSNLTEGEALIVAKDVHSRAASRPSDWLGAILELGAALNNEDSDGSDGCGNDAESRAFRVDTLEWHRRPIPLKTHIAGKPGFIIKDADVLKPVFKNRTEVAVYSYLQQVDRAADGGLQCSLLQSLPLKRLLPFVPPFRGTIGTSDGEYLRLANLLQPYRSAAFMDVKVGASLSSSENSITRTGAGNVLGFFVHGVASSFLQLRNRVNKYRGRKVPVDDMMRSFGIFMQHMGPQRCIIERVCHLIDTVKALPGVRFYSSSLLFVFDEHSESGIFPTVHLIDFERCLLCPCHIDGTKEVAWRGTSHSTTGCTKDTHPEHPPLPAGLADLVPASGGGGITVPPHTTMEHHRIAERLADPRQPDAVLLRSLRGVLRLLLGLWCPSVLGKSLPGQLRLRRPPQVILVRHGERLDYTDVEWARSQPYPHDPPLSPLGEMQAEDCVDRLVGLRPALIVSSPFQRAVLTAVPLSRRVGAPVCIEPGLNEFMCEKTRSRLPRYISEEVSVSPYINNDYEPVWPRLQLESWDRMRARIAHTVSGLIKRCSELDGDLVIISHRSTLTAVYEFLDSGQHPNARLEYGGLAVLERDFVDTISDVAERPPMFSPEAERARWRTVTFNEVAHMRRVVESPSSNPFRHIDGYYEDLSWDKYKK